MAEKAEYSVDVHFGDLHRSYDHYKYLKVHSMEQQDILNGVSRLTSQIMLELFEFNFRTFS